MRKSDARRVRILIHQRGLPNPGNGNGNGNGNEWIRFRVSKNGIAGKLERTYVPAVAENNDLEQGSPAQRHSSTYGGGATHSMVWFGFFASLFIGGFQDWIRRSIASTKGEKGSHFLSLSALFLLVLDRFRLRKKKS